MLEGATTDGSSSPSGLQNYIHEFTATLLRIPGLAVTSGKVRATAYVKVRVQ
ncbi:fimbrial protein [Diaphorobacter sp.]|uniref:fimbrial protein n=1 Tax=Diaphorobacter sp. TaxID=1934310 RepID=UPI0039180D4E